MLQEDIEIFNTAKAALQDEYVQKIQATKDEITNLKITNAKENLRLDITQGKDEEYTNINNEYYRKLTELQDELKKLEIEKRRLDNSKF